ncbi:PAS domain S-box-containing protein [Halomicrobium zhouii]|uniref:histidine kinase n=1 Tax=Halomicrobium zhouii TaxID=767519 RepID=A0A1I6M7I8_9EURY|nr:PAS domain-containing sensor histidine kinase [Halomicrobium zhouii]SFS11647.1 PAS domain S-box-containing protein [Halomicrobium zhouii]
MEEPVCVLYYGPDAAALEQRWETTERPFALSAFDDAGGAREFAAGTAVDALVCSGPDAMAVVDDVRDTVGHVPVVVLDDGETDAVAALADGVTHCLSVDERDRVDVIEHLEPVVSRYRDERRERTMLDSLLENIPLSVYFKDRQSRFLRVSDAMTSMMGDPYIESPDGVRYYAPADIVGTTDFDVFPNHLAEPATSDDRSVMENEEPIDRVEHAYGPAFDGSYVATSKAPWYDEQGDVVGLVGVTRDISERKQYEHQLERQNERLERFAEVISHDLRNPLEVAKSRLRFAREECESEHFDAIDRSLDRMDDLIADVLTITRYGETVDDPDLVDVATVAGDAWDVIDSQGATLAVNTELVIRADTGRLSQLFENLFRNSVEHGAEDPTDLTVTVDDLPHRSGFYVADDGVGIPEDERDSVFESGFSTDEEGTGLGLDIVRSIVDAHGWVVEAVESEGGGARFEFKNVAEKGR